MLPEQPLPGGRHPDKAAQPAGGAEVPGVAEPTAVRRGAAGRSGHAHAIPRSTV